MQENVNRIVSEDYADLVVETVQVQNILDMYPDAEAIPINFQISLVTYPVEFFTNNTIVELGYNVVPSLVGLVSESSLDASGVIKLRRIPILNLRGNGTLIGIYDTGIDYTNPIFQYPDGTTRIVSIWDQTIQSGNPPEGFLYGTEYTREEINRALKSENPFEIVPSRDTNGHGTMIAGIAGGNEIPKENFYGVATDAEFVVVKLKEAKKYLKEFQCIPPGAIAYQENDFAFALQYLVNVAVQLMKPMAICVAFGASEGPHDGRGTFNNYNALVAATPGIACMIAAGNEGNAKRHYFGMINDKTGYDIVELQVGKNEGNFTMQLWGEHPNFYTVDIISPSGEIILGITPKRDAFQRFKFLFEGTIIYVDYQLSEIQTGSQLIFFRFINPTPGIWKFKVHERGDVKIGFHIWLPMQGFISENTFFLRYDPYTTVSAYANNPVPITITAYNPKDESIYLEAGRGYSSIGVITPHIAAPGVNIIGPTLENGFAGFSGTSVAAAHAAGIAAMLLEWGVVQGNMPNMNSIEMKILLVRGARRSVTQTYPNREWGYGILDIFNVFNRLR
ncbi:S8 family peptidase [Anaeromicropila populeti]|uniref:Subtilase family protein n=1 Tax=Anaeromicropila populeti TaxID=37658 RepID=A0A1I6INH0_9FIRM|nr:S8 family peptidase [Anaeromicropila populeti]SFR68201.1 Subtilase family protein [Anaeromicropila populeti]